MPASQRGQRPIQVGGDPLGLVRAQLHGPGEERGRLRDFGFLIDHAAGGTAAECDRRRTLQDRDLLHVKGIAIVAAKVAHAVEENVVARGKAANRKVVALGAAFPRSDADAGNIAQSIAQRGRALVLDDVLGNDVDGLRGVDQGLSEFRQTRPARWCR